ncbi:MAG: DUF2298 domain-containing protein [Caldilineales bacterium]
MDFSASSRTPRGVVALLLLILLVGFVLRVWHIDYADGQLPHPDERSTIAFYAPSIHLPPAGVSLLDKRQSPLNPLWNVQTGERRSYTYGHFPLYVLVATANGLHELAEPAERLGASPDMVDTLRNANGVPGFAVVGRALMAVADTATVLLVFLLAQHLYGRRRPWVALLAAAFSAFSVIQIQLSHFFAVDPVSTTFTALALYGALRMADLPEKQRVPWAWAAISGIAAGLAIASKFSALPILAAPVTAVLLRWWQRHDDEDARALAALPAALLPALLALLLAFVAFFITSPFAVLDWENFNRAVLTEQGAMVRGVADFPFTRQYRGTIPYLYQIEQLVRWGLGWPLGLLTFVALAWVLLKALSGRARAGEWIILSWIVPYFGLTGLFLAKFMRYMQPVTPFLLVFAAGLIAALWRSSHTGHRAAEVDPPQTPAQPAAGAARYLAAALAAATLLGTVLWSFAFVNGVYNTTHPWITASRWIYANIPDNSTIAWEQWDDSLPYDLPEANASRSRYRFIDWGPFEEDNAEKYERLKSTLRTADVMVYSSNRIYGAVDNLPERYPMTTRYYQLMAEGKLGYELALKQVNHPTLFGVSFNDERADESFTLYDHPTVLVYRKVRDLSDAEWDALLGGSWEDAQPYYVGDPPLIQRLWPAGERQSPRPQAEPQPGEGKTLLLDTPLDQLPVVQDFRWNTLASSSPLLAVFTWWLVLALLGWTLWPISFVLLRGFADRGYLLSRSLGWLLLGYIVWLGASLRLFSFRTPVIVLVWLALAALSLALARRERAALRAFWQRSRRTLLLGEMVWSGAFLLFVLLRLANPDIWQPWNGGEKFMEFAFLNATLRSAHFPPLDPYFAGGVINYYYFGLYLVALLIKLTGIASSVAFNLAIPTVFALAVGNVWSLSYTLARGQAGSETAAPTAQPSQPALLPAAHPARIATLAAFFVALLGNVDGGAQVVRRLAELSGSQFSSNLPGVQTAVRALGGVVKVLGPERLPAYSFWDPSRVIPYTINEFPYWSFLFADLHPHMIGIGFTVLLLALAWRWLSIDEDGPASAGDRVALHVALALVLGALAVINTWDLPTYAGLLLLMALLRQWRSGRLASRPVPALLGAASGGGSLLALALLLYWPFFSHYQALASSGVGLVTAASPPGRWLAMWGFWLFLTLSALAALLRQHNRRGQPRDPLALRWLELAAADFDRLGLLVQRTPRLSSALLLLLGLVALVAAVLLKLDHAVAALLLGPLLLAALLVARRSRSTAETFIAVLFFSGLLVLWGVEIFYLKDHLQGGEWRRMNTLFKFYIQAWVMLGMAAALSLPTIWRFVCARWHPALRGLWLAGFSYLLLLSLLFLPLGTAARLADRFPQGTFGENRPALGTLDGMAYMQAGTYTWHPDPAQSANTPIVLRYDYDALRWMLDHVSGTPVVAEALIGYYREGGLRVASFTGLPTLLGFHQEGEQRYGWQTGPRRTLAEEFWQTTDLDRTRQLLAELDISYIYVGQLEQIVYPAASLAKFQFLAEPADGTAPALEIAYHNDRVVVYHVLPN